MSYGIIAIKKKDGVLHYLLIQRRDSMSYVEFLRGKYKFEDSAYIKLLLNGMTAKEHERLLNQSFETLWTTLWHNQNTRQYRNEYEHALKQFNTFRNTGDIYGRILSSYIADIKNTWTTPEWGFPKGRRNSGEDTLSCALREFTEETGIMPDCIKIKKEQTYIEQYIGTNGISYKQTYFLGECEPEINVSIDTDNIVMTREVGDIEWLKYDEAYNRIRATNVEKRELLSKIHSLVTTDCLI
jgi:8-oxo-dGTP pyrophosphatase MutT (NUDIX family)